MEKEKDYIASSSDRVYKDYSAISLPKIEEASKLYRYYVDEFESFMQRILSGLNDKDKDRDVFQFVLDVDYLFDADYIKGLESFFQNTEELKNAILRDYCVVSLHCLRFVSDPAIAYDRNLYRTKRYFAKLDDIIVEMQQRGYNVEIKYYGDNKNTNDVIDDISKNARFMPSQGSADEKDYLFWNSSGMWIKILVYNSRLLDKKYFNFNENRMDFGNGKQESVSLTTKTNTRILVR